MQPDLMLDTEAIRRWTYELWLAAGCCAEEARITADHLIEANLSGHDSHGLSVVPGYVRSLLSDQLQLNALDGCGGGLDHDLASKWDVDLTVRSMQLPNNTKMRYVL